MIVEYDTATADVVQWCVHDYPKDTCPYCALIEECARAALQYNHVSWGPDDYREGIALAIRALKDKP